jgi:hypothetical protein
VKKSAADLRLGHIERARIRRTFRHGNLLLEGLDREGNYQVHGLARLNGKVPMSGLETIHMNIKFIGAWFHGAEAKLAAHIGFCGQSTSGAVQFRHCACDSCSTLILDDPAGAPNDWGALRAGLRRKYKDEKHRRKKSKGDATRHRAAPVPARDQVPAKASYINLD